MTDPEELTPAEEADVTRLLAEAGGPVDVPPDVAARLDDVLAGLVAERGQDVPGPGDLVPAALARRRRWPRVLMAAAAVLAVGYGGVTIVTQPSSEEAATAGAAGPSRDDPGTAAGGARDGGVGSSHPAEAAPEFAGDQHSSDSRATEPGEAPNHVAEPPTPLAGALVDERTDLTRAAAALDTLAARLGAPDFQPGPKRDGPGYREDTTRGGATGCAQPRLGPGDASTVVRRADGSRAVVVLRAGESARRAELYHCDQPWFPVAVTLVLAVH